MFQLQNQQGVCLIVNADDLGYSASRDQAAFQLIEQGAVTSASLLVNMPNSRHAAEHCLKIGFRVGLHLNLTEGTPLTGKTSTLTNSSGAFMGKAAFYDGGSVPHKINDEDLYEQISCQLEWFVRVFDRLPTHLDGHNHVHMVPAVAKVLVAVMEQYGCYKYRLPNEQLLVKPSDFQRQLLANVKQAMPIFQQRNMITTTHFIGLQLIYHFQLEDIETALQSIRLQSTCRETPVYVELMTHPGLADTKQCPESDPFHSSQDRQEEFKILGSERMKELLKQYRLVGWGGLADAKPYRQRRILLHSMMKRGTGNQTSCLRLRDILQDLGYVVYLRNVYEHSQQVKQNEARDIDQFCRDFAIDLVIGVNIYRSGIILKDAFYDPTRICCQVPYFLIIAGTDANVYFKQSQFKQDMLEAIRLSQGLIALNESLSQAVKEQLGPLSTTNIQLIPQSECEAELDATELEAAKVELGLGGRPYIIFPASLRKVKDVGFALPQLNRIIEKYGVDVIVLGPIIEPSYSESLKQEFKGVKYVGTVSHQKLIALLKHSVCLINTSISEGMSNAILEAQINRVLAIVRANDGNRHLVQHQQTGLLFTTADELEQHLAWTIENPTEAKLIAEQAYRTSLERFSREKEVASYRALLGSHFSREVDLKCSFSNFFLLGSEFSHPISEINCRLFDQIPMLDGGRVLDLGCGTGVLSFYYLSRNKPGAVKELTLSDISFRALSNCLFNLIQNRALFANVGMIRLLQSDMFDQINKRSLKYDVVLANMPQTPFPEDGFRQDKNGGRDGFKFNKLVLEEVARLQHTTLVTLYSHMSYPSQYFSTLQALHLQVSQESQPLNHRIMPADFNGMHPRLEEYLLKLKAEGVCCFSQEDGTYLVPAQLLVIRKM